MLWRMGDNAEAEELTVFDSRRCRVVRLLAIAGNELLCLDIKWPMCYTVM